MNQNELYWKAIADNQIKDEFNDFLRDQNMECGPESAQIFAMKRIAAGNRDRTERELILLLAGELPFAYD